jgi:hypothetical protein
MNLAYTLMDRFNGKTAKTPKFTRAKICSKTECNPLSKGAGTVLSRKPLVTAAKKDAKRNRKTLDDGFAAFCLFGKVTNPPETKDMVVVFEDCKGVNALFFKDEQCYLGHASASGKVGSQFAPISLPGALGWYNWTNSLEAGCWSFGNAYFEFIEHIRRALIAAVDGKDGDL